MTDADETIPLLVTLGHPGDGTFNLRFPPEYRDEIVSLLDDHRIGHGTILEFSAGSELAIEAVKVLGVVGAGGGLVAFASMIKTFAHRHDGKRIVLKDGEAEEIVGFSAKQTEQFLRRREREQAELDARWRE
jgi:hypothetical protein